MDLGVERLYKYFQRSWLQLHRIDSNCMTTCMFMRFGLSFMLVNSDGNKGPSGWEVVRDVWTTTGCMYDTTVLQRFETQNKDSNVEENA